MDFLRRDLEETGYEIIWGQHFTWAGEGALAMKINVYGAVYPPTDHMPDWLAVVKFHGQSNDRHAGGAGGFLASKVFATKEPALAWLNDIRDSFNHSRGIGG